MTSVMLKRPTETAMFITPKHMNVLDRTQNRMPTSPSPYSGQATALVTGHIALQGCCAGLSDISPDLCGSS